MNARMARSNHRRATALHRRVATATIAAAALFGACAGDGDDGSAPTEPSTETYPSDTEASTTLGPVRTTVSTAVPTTAAPPVTVTAPTSAAVSTSGPTSTPPCPAAGSTDDVEYAFPSGLSALVGVEIRTGGHECFERIVVELAPYDSPVPAAFPGYWIRYEDGPVFLGESDETVEIAGDATMLITIASWMYDTGADGRPTEYAGAIDLFPSNVTFIEEIRLVDNWEGVHTWAIGLDRARPFVVERLSSPDRLVVDLQR
jgi:hypothetical protein